MKMILACIASIFLIAASPDRRTIGGDRDSHGCYLGAGYTWCPTSQKCARQWEEPCIPDRPACEGAGSRYNECSNKCRLENQGNPDSICPALCETLCECGGDQNTSCPAGFICRAPQGNEALLGYCVPGE